MNRESAIIFVVSQIKNLLEKLGVKDTDQKVKACVIIRDNGEYGSLFLANTGQIQLVRHGHSRQAFQVELFQPCRQGDLDGFQGLGGPGTVIAIILQGDVLGRFCLQPIHKLVEGGYIAAVILLGHVPGAQQLQNHGKVLLIGRGFILEVKD